MNRLFRCFMVLAALSGSAVAQDASEQPLIVAAQNVPAVELDSTLPPVPLADWLGSLARPPAGLVWEVNDCGEQTGGPADKGRDFPACVEAILPVGSGMKAHVSLMVGTFGRGVIGEPELFQLYVERDGKYQDLKKLSELQAFANGQSK